MMPITLWSKPSCVQCDAVKRRLVEKITGNAGSPVQVKAEFQRLVDEGVVTEFDLTAPEHASDLTWFKSIGYTAAPITEYRGSAVPGYVPTAIDDLVAAWRADNPTEAAA